MVWLHDQAAQLSTCKDMIDMTSFVMAVLYGLTYSSSPSARCFPSSLYKGASCAVTCKDRLDLYSIKFASWYVPCSDAQQKALPAGIIESFLRSAH